MRILILTNNMRPDSGWGSYASDLVSGLRKAGHEVVILKEEADGHEGIPILKSGANLFLSAIKIRKYLKNCDVVHALDVYPYGVTAYLANLFLRKKLVITAQGTYSIAPFYNLKTKYLSKIACNSAVAVIAISNYTKNELMKQVRVKRVEVINHGIDLKKFHRERKILERPYILSVGALKHRKGYHVSIEAFTLARKIFPDLEYKIVGSQKQKNYFDQLQGVPGVEFLSNISDEKLGQLYSGAKLFILTSVNEGHHFEGFGLVFLEAAAAGLPVIGTLGNGIEDAVKNGYNGLLVPQNNVERTAEAIISILSDNEKMEKMSQASYQWAKNHDITLTINKYLDLYKQL